MRTYHFVKFIQRWNLARRNDGKTNSFLFTKKIVAKLIQTNTIISNEYSHVKTESRKQ